MNNLSVLKPTFLSFLFFMLHLIAVVTSKSRYTPTDNIALSCGTSTNVPTLNGTRQWIGENNSKFALIEQSNNKSVTAKVNTQVSSVSVPYMNARISRSQFTYSFSVTPGQKFIRLHFYPASYPPHFNKYKDFFTVKAGPFTLLQNFSASLFSDHINELSFIKEYCLNVEEGDQKLNITFAPSFSSNEIYAFINGIEIVSMPPSLYYTSPLFFSVGQNNNFTIENTALETIYRLNVGGNSISPMNDTGMYRQWFEDNYYIAPPDGMYRQWSEDIYYGFVPVYSNISLTWLKIPNYTAPDQVYQTALSMGPNRTTNLQYNMTWQLLVDHGFWYLVRLHFCEVMAVNDRRFRIYIDNKTAEESFDVMESSGGKGIPMVKDYPVLIGNNTKDHGSYNLFIALSPNVSVSSYADHDAFLNGIEVFKLSNHDGNLAVPGPKESVLPSGSTAQKSKTNQKLIIAGCAVGLFTIVLSLQSCMVIWQLRKRNYGSYYKLLWCWRWLNHCKGESSRTRSSLLPYELCRHFSLAEIKVATNNFRADLIIGVGGFGNVYKGFMNDGSKVVAIKRLNPESSQGAHEFRTEIEMLSQLRHVHLVSLIGYCNDKSEMILVYDFMINGTLRDHLYDTKYDPLPWKQRLQICKGAAIGLHYLHTGLEHTIIHRDVKTTNILLDEKWMAKVSDFGLSKMDRQTSMLNTDVKGTWGYLDPEYARGHPLTEKSDVYSFGVVLFEVLCARKALDRKLEEDQVNLVHWAQKCLENGTFYHIIDPYLMGKIAPECFKVFLEIAESCVREERIKRPTMYNVTEKLIFALELQENEDAKKVRIYPSGEYMYPAISFHVVRDDNVDGGTEIESSIWCTSTTIDTNTTGMSIPSHDSASATVLWETSSSKGQ